MPHANDDTLNNRFAFLLSEYVVRIHQGISGQPQLGIITTFVLALAARLILSHLESWCTIDLRSPSSAIAGSGLTTRQTGSSSLSPDDEPVIDFEEQNDAGAVDAESSYPQDIRLTPEEESGATLSGGQPIRSSVWRISTEQPPSSMVAGGSGSWAETLPPYLRIAEASRALHGYELVWHDDQGGDDKDDYGGCETKDEDEGDDDDKDDNTDDDDDSDEAGAENAVHISQQGRNTGDRYNQTWTETSTSEDCETPLSDQISPRANEVGQYRIGSSPQAPPELIDDQENTAQLIETYNISTLASNSKNKGDVTSEHRQQDEKIGCRECTLPVADSLEGLSYDSLLTTKRRRGSWQFRPELCSSLSFDEAECLGSKATPAIDMGGDEVTPSLAYQRGLRMFSHLLLEVDEGEIEARGQVYQHNGNGDSEDNGEDNGGDEVEGEAELEHELGDLYSDHHQSTDVGNRFNGSLRPSVENSSRSADSDMSFNSQVLMLSTETRKTSSPSSAPSGLIDPAGEAWNSLIIDNGESAPPPSDSLEGLAHDTPLTATHRRGTWNFIAILETSLSFDEAGCLGPRVKPTADTGINNEEALLPIYPTEHDTAPCVRAKADCEVGDSDVVEVTSDVDVRERRGLRNGRWGVCMESHVEPGNTSLLPAFVRL